MDYGYEVLMFGYLDTIYDNLPCRRGKVHSLFRIILKTNVGSVPILTFLKSYSLSWNKLPQMSPTDQRQTGGAHNNEQPNMKPPLL